MNKAITLVLSIAALALGFVLYYTGLFTPMFAWLNVNVWPHITNFFVGLKANPVLSGTVGTLTGGGVLAVAKSIYSAQKESAVNAVTIAKQEEVNQINGQLFQANQAQTETEKTITTLNGEITDLKARLDSTPDKAALLETQLTQKQNELDQLRSDYNALQRLMAEIKTAPQVIVK